MQVKQIGKVKGFQPIKLEVIIETEEELKALYAQLCVNSYNTLDDDECYNKAEKLHDDHDKLISPLFMAVTDSCLEYFD